MARQESSFLGNFRRTPSGAGRGKIIRKLLPFIISVAAFFFACSSHQAPAHKKPSPQEMKASEIATDLSTRADALKQKAPDVTSAADFADSAERFDYESLRYGAGSLESRDAFEKLRYHATQLEKEINENRKDLAAGWKA